MGLSEYALTNFVTAFNVAISSYDECVDYYDTEVVQEATEAAFEWSKLDKWEQFNEALEENDGVTMQTAADDLGVTWQAAESAARIYNAKPTHHIGAIPLYYVEDIRNALSRMTEDNATAIAAMSQTATIQGLSAGEIAAYYGVPQTDVALTLDTQHVDPIRECCGVRYYAVEDIAPALEYYKGLATIESIVDEIGCEPFEIVVSLAADDIQPAEHTASGVDLYERERVVESYFKGRKAEKLAERHVLPINLVKVVLNTLNCLPPWVEPCHVNEALRRVVSMIATQRSNKILNACEYCPLSGECMTQDEFGGCYECTTKPAPIDGVIKAAEALTNAIKELKTARSNE